MVRRRMRVAGRKRRAPRRGRGRWSGPRRRLQVQQKQPVHYFKRSVYLPGAIIAAGVDTPFAVAYALNSIPNHTEFTALYDQYKITGIKAKFIPRGNSSAIGNNSIGSLFTVLDLDDTVVPTGGVGQLMQYQNMKMCRSTQSQTRYWKPKFNVAAVNTIAGGTVGKLNTTGFIDVTDDQVQHFGLKGILQVANPTTVTYDMLVTLYLAFKNVR